MNISEDVETWLVYADESCQELLTISKCTFIQLLEILTNCEDVYIVLGSHYVSEYDEETKERPKSATKNLRVDFNFYLQDYDIDKIEKHFGSLRKDNCGLELLYEKEDVLECIRNKLGRADVNMLIKHFREEANKCVSQ